jgi:SAM-dependent methyltransferase
MDEISRGKLYENYLSKFGANYVENDFNNLISHRKHYFKKFIKRCFPKNFDSKIFEIGCGYGALIYVARTMGYKNIAGVDRSDAQVNSAINLGIEDIQCGDAIEILNKFKSNELDCIVAFDVVEHLNKNELIKLLEDIYNKLKNGGRLILHVPNATSPFFGLIRYGDFTHELAFTNTSLTQLLTACSFSKMEFVEDLPAVHGILSLLRLVLWKIIRTILKFYLIVETGKRDSGEVLSLNITVIAYKYQN